jgi:energy-coupling factor transporter ATP-binding protein EcfA2
LLLLDEPMGALDDERKAEIMPYLNSTARRRRRADGAFVSHDADEMRQLATQVVMLKRGRVAAPRRGLAPTVGSARMRVRHAGLRPDHAPDSAAQLTLQLAALTRLRRVSFGGAGSSSSGSRRPTTLTRPPPRLRATRSMLSIGSAAPTVGAWSRWISK